jgi:outer membrane protein OmpA-like peptidoglycan-associated protein
MNHRRRTRAMKHREFPRITAVCAMGGLALTAACSSTPPQNAALNQAQTAYTRASQNPQVSRFAPGTLTNSQEALQTAQEAWNQDEDRARTEHYAYLSQRYAQTAEESARARAAAEQVVTASRMLTLGDARFATGKADIDAEGQQALGKLATFMKENPDRTAVVTGHTDSTGSAQLNQELSVQRADAARRVLIADGVDAGRLQARGVGPANPIASNDTAAGRAQNRRVEIAVSSGAPITGVGSGAPMTGVGTSSGASRAPTATGR